MPPRNWRLRVADILDAINRIHTYTAGMTFEVFRSDSRTVDAVIRNLEIIGEASRHVPDELKREYASVPWRQMLGLRNFAIHQYEQVNLGTIWVTLEDDLSPIIPKLQRMLTDAPEVPDAP